MPDGRRIVVLGAMAQMPFAGVIWQVLHYLEGLRRLGHRVTYVEDSGNWPYDPELETITDDASGAVRRLRHWLEWGGCERWAFVNAARPEEVWGCGAAALAAELRDAEILINLSGATILAEAHRAVPVRIYLETDPVGPQLEIALGRTSTIELLAAHTHHFSFGERLGREGCGVPVDRFTYRPTRQPVVLDWWPVSERFPAAPPGGVRFTTVGNWEQSHKDVEFEGETFTWSKSAEFLKLLAVPRRSGAEIELALALDEAAALGILRDAGFAVRPAGPLSDDPLAYRDYITASAAEFTAAKDQNVRLRSGWFSDRTATYLAAGRPAVVQDTGFDIALPTGEGLLRFRTPDEAVQALQAVAADYPRHSRAARAIAEAHFRAESVLAALLAEVGA